MKDDAPLTNKAEVPIDRLLSLVMEAIRAKSPSLKGWCDRKTREVNGFGRVKTFIWLVSDLDDDNLRIFAETVELTVGELLIASKVAKEILE